MGGFPRWAALLIAGIALLVLNDALEIHDVVWAFGVILVVIAVVDLVVGVMRDPQG